MTPEDIDIVIDTHLHFDHCGGNTRVEKDKVVPTFPNAQYFVQKGEYEHALNPTERDRASYFESNYVPIQESGQLRCSKATSKSSQAWKWFACRATTPICSA